MADGDLVLRRVMTPEEMDLQYKSAQKQNESRRAKAMNETSTQSTQDALSAALKSYGGVMNNQKGSFFSAAKNLLADNRQDLEGMLNSSPETQFLGKPQPSATPTPTPGATKPSQMSLADLYDHFGVPNPLRQSPSSNLNLYQNKPDQQVYNWRNNYNWS